MTQNIFQYYIMMFFYATMKPIIKGIIGIYNGHSMLLYFIFCYNFLSQYDLLNISIAQFLYIDFMCSVVALFLFFIFLNDKTVIFQLTEEYRDKKWI